jgi:hypothetical protein
MICSLSSLMEPSPRKKEEQKPRRIDGFGEGGEGF